MARVAEGPREHAQSSDVPACRKSGSVSRSSARITGPMRCRVTSQRRLPGSHMPPSRCRMWAKSCGNGPPPCARIRGTRPGRCGRAGGGGERKGLSWSREAQSRGNRPGVTSGASAPSVIIGVNFDPVQDGPWQRDLTF